MPSPAAYAPTSPSADCFRSIKLLVLDFDGVLTDDRVLVGADGSEYVMCSRSDGLGIARLKQCGLPMLILSSETNPVVTARANKLGIPARQGLSDKLEALKQVAAERGVALQEIAFVGNDINDLDCLRAVGLAIAPADAQPAVLEQADIVLSKLGGRGAVRELAERILASGWCATARVRSDA